MYREFNFRFARRSLGILEEIGSIAIHVVAFSILRLMAGVQSHYGMPILPFTASGVYTYWLFRTGVAQVSTSLLMGARYSSFPIVTPLDIGLARGLVNVLLYIGIALASFYFLQLIGYSGPIRDVVKVVGLLLTAGLFGIGAGMVCAGIFHYVEIMRTVVLVGGLRFLSLVSGVFFVYPDLPYKLRPYAEWLPLLHLNDMLRAAYFPTYEANWASPSYVAIWVVGALSLGLVVERALRRVVAHH
jgi:capsular polysaccharide transport system permease protein